MDIEYSTEIRKIVDQKQSGGMLTLNDFPEDWPRNTVTQVLSRIVGEGKLERVKRGVYSKITETRFGKLKSSSVEIIANEIKADDNKCFGGLFLFNNLGLTTQVPNTIEVLNNKSSYKHKVGSTLVRYVRIRPKITKENKQLIIFLEVLKSSKKIPDGSARRTYDWLKKKVYSFSVSEVTKLVDLSLEYPPRVRAMLGSLIEGQNSSEACKIEKTLKNNTPYSIGYIAEYFTNRDKWRLRFEASPTNR
jgi:hypothetical protein